VIYFIHDTVSGAIKIGHAWNPSKRLSTLQISTPNKLILLGSIPGTKRVEQMVHELVWINHAPPLGKIPGRPLCLQGEWFDDRILPFITELMRSPKEFLGTDPNRSPNRSARKDPSLLQCKIVLTFDSGETFQERFLLKLGSPSLAMTALESVAEARRNFLANIVQITQLSVPGCQAKKVNLRGSFETRDCRPNEGMRVVFNSGLGMATLDGVKQYVNRWLHGVPYELFNDENPWCVRPTDQCRQLLDRFAAVLERSQCVIGTRPALLLKGLTPRGIGSLPKGELRSKAYQKAASKRKRPRSSGEPTRIRNGVVYFILDTTSHAIKIGFCLKNPEKRLAALQTGNSNALRLLGYVYGIESHEKFLHKQFSPYHRQGEWFSVDILSGVDGILKWGSVQAWVDSQSAVPLR
jgi:hypothetical protein